MGDNYPDLVDTVIGSHLKKLGNFEEKKTMYCLKIR